MKHMRRHMMAVALALVVPAVAGGGPAASAHNQYAGTCVVALQGDAAADGSSMAVTTTSNGLCVVNGTSARITLTGNLVPTVPGQPFSCLENIGQGSVELRYWDNLVDVEPTAIVGDATFRAVDVASGVSGVTVKETAGQHLAGTFHGARTAPLPQACENEDDPVTWTVEYTFALQV